MQKSNLSQRVTTALLISPILILAIIFAPMSVFAIVSALILLLGSWEWTNLIPLSRTSHRIAYVLLHAATMIALWILSQQLQRLDFDIGILSSVTLLWLLSFIFVYGYAKNISSLNQTPLFKAINGVILVVGAWFALNLLRDLPHGKMWVTIVLLIICMADVFAYFSGKRFGKKKLVPRVSPGKTIAGALGAVIASLFFAALSLIFLPYEGITALLWLLLVAVCIIISIGGDLYISVLKRECDLKDTGQLLPGHGGLLDRIDSILAALPFFVTGIKLLGAY